MSNESKATLGQLCTPENLSKSIVMVKVSNALLEVKLTTSDDSGFVNKLLQIGALQDGHKFSKYLTGAMKLHSDKIKSVPYWAALQLFDELFGWKVTKPEEPPILAHGKRPSSNSLGECTQHFFLVSLFWSTSLAMLCLTRQARY